MGIGFVILAHEHLRRTRQLARALASKNRKVVIHVDAGACAAEYDELCDSFKNSPNILFAPRRACEWGRFSLVEAGLAASQMLLNTWPDVSHVMQISGSCLPVRPLPELEDFLARNPTRDFVESVPAIRDAWVENGLSDERFTLFFPFSWKRQRWLFDRCVDFQRKLGIKRKIPEDIAPHLGSQWWCLTAQTLRGIITDPRRGEFDAFFRKCWIPDESYVPTLVHRHSENVFGKSLTLSTFDEQGKPYIFYDDHGDMLAQTDHFFVRKVWPGAEKLYRRFLSKKPKKDDRKIASDLGLGLIFAEAKQRSCAGRDGLRHAGRFPSSHHERQTATCRDYSVFMGFGHVFEGFQTWLEATTGALAHGRLYKHNAVQFALGLEQLAAGSLPANPKIRDLQPEQFLSNLLWNQSDRHQSLMLELCDNPRISQFVAHDPNARLFVLRGSWVLDLYHRSHADPQILKRQAKRLCAEEAAFHRELAKTGRVDVTFLALADTVVECRQIMRQIQDTVRPGIDLRPKITMGLRHLDGLRQFVEELNAIGIETTSLGPIPACLPGEPEWRDAERIQATA